MPQPVHLPQFPIEPGDPFYKQFDDPLRAYWNLYSLYLYITLPGPTSTELDHVRYATALARKYPDPVNLPATLPTKKELLG
jgi:hypothetical protein